MKGKLKLLGTLCAMFLILICGMPAEAKETWYTVEGVIGGQIEFDPETGTITDCEQSVTKAEIPAEIDGVTVEKIGTQAFFNCSSISTLTIPEGVTEIGESAFSGCNSLSHITIPEKATSIGGKIFERCKLLKSAGGIGSGCNIEFGWTYIPSDAFENCSSLSSVRIPEGVTLIEDYAFFGCSSLSSVTIPEGVTSIEESVFSGCSSLSSVRIPEGVTSIESYAFSGCSSLSSVRIPEGVTFIGLYAFEGCSSLESVTIPEGVTSIGYSAFEGCSSLESVTIPEGVTSIESSAFEGCSSLESVTIPEGVTSIGSFAFEGCSSLESVTIPEGVTSIRYRAFLGCSSLESVTIPEGVTSIESSAFSGCSSLESVTIPEGVASIESSTFSGCSSLESVTIPEGVTSIGSFAFEGCSSLESVTIPEGVTGIGDFAFSECSSLESVTIPEGVTSIGSYAFYNCSSLKKLEIYEKDCKIGTDEEWEKYHQTLGDPSVTVIYGYADSTVSEYAKTYGYQFKKLTAADKKYTVSYNGNGGSNVPSSQMKTHGKTLSLTTKKPLRDGYTFLGWSTSKTAVIAEYQPGGNYKIDASVTLYAVWKLNSDITVEAFRLSGTSRYETGYKVANALKERLGVDKFDAVIIATGQNFADALAGSYLSACKDAPILLTNGKIDNILQLHDYIRENVNAGGTIYILGGESAVPKEIELISGYQICRLEGASRYDTNIAILNEAGIDGEELIVATGKTFADSLSASAAKLPILLVKPNSSLSEEQKAILREVSGGTIYIIGGEGAVSGEIERELAKYAYVERISGATRYETSVKVAETFFGEIQEVVLASGKNFPDGLCGGALAAAMDAPLILTTDGKTYDAAGYLQKEEVTSGYVLGGSGALSDESVVDVFKLVSAEDIIQK